MFIKQIVVVLLVSLAVACLAYPSGAPDRVCDTMSPNHTNSAPYPDPAPYTLVIETVNPTVGSPISGHIECSDGYTTLRGFMIKALTDSNDPATTAVGTFSVGEDEKNIRVMNCSGGNTAVTHTDKADKTCTDIKFTWVTAIDQIVYFRATVVYNFTVFWENNIVSTAVNVTGTVTTTTGGNTATSPGGNTATSPGGNTATSPGGNTATSPGGNTATSPGGNTATSPGGNTATSPGGNTATTSGDLTTSRNVTTTTHPSTTGAEGLSVSLMAFLLLLTSSWFTSKMF